jgi:hypothetical protein
VPDVAGNGLIDRRALLGRGILFAGAAATGTGGSLTSAATEPLPVDPWPSIRAAEINVETATTGDLQAAFQKGTLTSEKLTQIYLGRIAAYDKHGPAINAIITLNPTRWLKPERWTRNARPARYVGRCMASRLC